MCNGLLPKAGWLFAKVTKTHILCIATLCFRKSCFLDKSQEKRYSFNGVVCHSRLPITLRSPGLIVESGLSGLIYTKSCFYSNSFSDPS